MTDEEQERRDAVWARGHRAAWVAVLREALHQLGYDDPQAGKAAWVTEREAAVAQLRMLCDDHGDNDWPDTLHLADVIEKHLAPHLAAPE